MIRVGFVFYGETGRLDTAGVRLDVLNDCLSNSTVFCGNTKLLDKKNYRLCPKYIVVLRKANKALGKYGLRMAFIDRMFSFFFDSWVIRNLEDIELVHLFSPSLYLANHCKKIGIKVISEGYTHPKALSTLQRKFQLPLSVKGLKSLSRFYDIPDMIIAPSNWVHETMTLGNIQGHKVQIVPYFIQKKVALATRSNSVFDCVFGCAGGLKREKGGRELLLAWKKLYENYGPGIKLVIAGSVWQEFKNDLNTNGIKYLGKLSSMDSFYREIDVHVLPTYMEGSSKTNLEAASYGIPILTTRQSGFPFDINHCGVEIAVGNYLSLYNGMERLLLNKDIRKSLGDNAKSSVQELTKERYTENIVQLYEKAVRNS